MIEKLDLQRVCEMSQAVSDAVELVLEAQKRVIRCKENAAYFQNLDHRQRDRWLNTANDYETIVINRLKLRAKRKAEELQKLVDSLT